MEQKAEAERLSKRKAIVEEANARMLSLMERRSQLLKR